LVFFKWFTFDLVIRRKVMGRDSYDNGSRSDSGRGVWIFGLVLGVLGGTALALLTAPKTGREIRGAIKDTAQNMPGKVNELVDESLDVYASALNYFQLVIEEQTLRLKRAVAAGKLAAAKKREELEMGGSSVLPFQHR
jgi:gas vesicle protein